MQYYLLFQPIFKYFKTSTSNDRIIAWKSRGFSEGSIKLRATSDNSVNPEINHRGRQKKEPVQTLLLICLDF